MSSADPTEVSVVVSREGVTVEKSFEPEDFPVPAIAFVVRSERDEAVTVTLTDGVPDGVAPEDIGFHPKYGAEHWSVEGERIVFEREFEAGEEYTTVYGLRSDTEDIEAYLEEPDIESVDPPLEDASLAVQEVMNESDEEAADEADAEEVDASTDIEIEDPEPDADAEAEDDDDEEEQIEPLQLNDPNDAAAEASDEDDDGDDGDDELSIDLGTSMESMDDADLPSEPVPRSSSETGGNDLVAALAAEVRAGDVSDDDLETLRDALGVSESGSTDARIKRLQTEFADLQAYTDELEAFLDENGGAKQALTELRDRVDRLESAVKSVDTRSEENAERIATVDADLAAVDDEVSEAADHARTAAEKAESAAEQAQTAQDRAGQATDVVETVAESIDEVEEQIQTLDDEVTAVREEFDAVYDDLDGLRDSVDAVETDLEDVAEDAEAAQDLAGRIDDLQSDLESTRDDIETRLDRVDDDLDSLAEMRDRLTSAFGSIAEGDEE